jgi:hypothetical protein
VSAVCPLASAFPFELPMESDDRFKYVFSGNIKGLLTVWKKEIPADALGQSFDCKCMRSALMYCFAQIC